MVLVRDDEIVRGAVRGDLVLEGDGLALGGGNAVGVHAYHEAALVGAGAVRIAVIGDDVAGLVLLAAPETHMPGL